MRRLRLAPFFGIAALEEVPVREMQQVQPAEQLHPFDPDQIGREQRREDAECERADEAVPQRLLLIAPGKAEDHHGQDERVVGAEQPFEQHQQPDGHEISGLNVHARRGWRLDTTRVNAYVWIDARLKAERCASNTISTLSAWLRGCWTCTRRRCASTNVLASSGRRGRLAACGCIPATSSIG